MKRDGTQHRVPFWLRYLLQAGLAGLVTGGAAATAVDRSMACALGGVTALMILATALRNFSALRQRTAQLERLLDQRTKALTHARDAVVFGLAKLAESRDDDTSGHLERVQCYVEILAGELAQSRPDLEVPDVPLLGIASSLHDIGKVGIPDAILLKPGRLTPAERELMESHTLIGGDCLTALRSRMPDDAFLDLACEVAFAHHERWDGKGYPFGLRGEQIPLSARIVTLADVYDALTTKRVYKPAMPHEKAVELISNSAGTQFDPDVVAAFLEREAEFRAVRERLETDAAAFSLANKRIRESEAEPALV